MSTRAVIRFLDDTGVYSLYLSGDAGPDGPNGVIAQIVEAFKFTWPLPRFQAGEFAAGFCAANKPSAYESVKELGQATMNLCGGTIRFLNSPANREDVSYIPNDVDYVYNVTFDTCAGMWIAVCHRHDMKPVSAGSLIDMIIAHHAKSTETV